MTEFWWFLGCQSYC